ncbi:MAG: ABC transporter ATP-binding protein [Parvibaculaceae bacterium]
MRADIFRRQHARQRSNLELVNISKSYGSMVAVRDLSFVAQGGEFVTLLGPSGSGKTTTLSMIAGFVTPDAGRILIAGNRIDHLPPESRDIGVVFQHYALFPHMTVAENIAFPLRMRALPAAEIADKVRLLIDAVQLGRFAERFPAQLSGGQQQRVALARALVFDPPILLLDEPLGALDKNLREDMQFEIKRIHRDTGMTMIYVTHDQDEALSLSDRIAVMNEGEIVQSGTPGELYWNPETEFVARFIGESNFIEAAVEQADGRSCALNVLGRTVPFSASARKLAAGQKINLMLRPEHIKLCPEHDAIASGIVEESLFFGNRRKLRIAATTGAQLLASVVCRQSDMEAAVGSTVHLRWDDADVRLFDPS